MTKPDRRREGRGRYFTNSQPKAKPKGERKKERGKKRKKGERKSEEEERELSLSSSSLSLSASLIVLAFSLSLSSRRSDCPQIFGNLRFILSLHITRNPNWLSHSLSLSLEILIVLVLPLFGLLLRSSINSSTVTLDSWVFFPLSFLGV